MPPPTLSTRSDSDLTEVALASWVRGLLLAIVLGLSTVFGIAIWLQPYQEDGSARRLATHRQLGLPPCTFVEVTGVPCPACGMTTSFALLVRGDLVNSVRANWVGTLLASFCALFVPWALTSVVLGRPLFVRSLEKGLLGVIMTLLVLMFLRWGVVLALHWLAG